MQSTLAYGKFPTVDAVILMFGPEKGGFIFHKDPFSTHRDIFALHFRVESTCAEDEDTSS